MTYREHVQALMKEINQVYDKAEGLRDSASENEKRYWNELRSLMNSAWNRMNALDRVMSDKRASMELGNFKTGLL